MGLFLAREIKRKGFIDSILSKFNAVMLLCKLVQGGCICKLAGEKEAATIFFSWGGGGGWVGVGAFVLRLNLKHHLLSVTGI